MHGVHYNHHHLVQQLNHFFFVTKRACWSNLPRKPNPIDAAVPIIFSRAYTADLGLVSSSRKHVINVWQGDVAHVSQCPMFERLYDDARMSGQFYQTNEGTCCTPLLGESAINGYEVIAGSYLEDACVVSYQNLLLPLCTKNYMSYCWTTITACHGLGSTITCWLWSRNIGVNKATRQISIKVSLCTRKMMMLLQWKRQRSL